MRKMALIVAGLLVLLRLDGLLAQESENSRDQAQNDRVVIENTQIEKLSNQDSFKKYYDEIYQIRVISPSAGSKSAIGSGFQISADGLIVTNYHVVSSFVQSPEVYEIEFSSHTGAKGNLTLLDFDVINDLALLRTKSPGDSFLNVSNTELAKGEIVHALGNPYDLGVTLVSGPSNGFIDHSYINKISYSGSLNPGMSGGPAINENGEVVAVNVATAGNQLSFLIPASAVTTMRNKQRALKVEDYSQEISDQIKSWQALRVKELVESDWLIEEFAGYELFGELRKDFQCWGGTNEESTDPTVSRVKKTCQSGDSIYLDKNLDAGHLYFSFVYEESLKLNTMQFAARSSSGMSANNNSSFKNSTNYKCHVDFLEEPAIDNSYIRATTCIRAFKRLAGLYDSLLLIENIGTKQRLTSHLSLSALEPEQITQLNGKFMELVK